MKNIEEFKNHFASSDLIHLNNSGQCPIPDANRDLAFRWINRIYAEGAFCAMEGWAQVEVTRKKLANFLGAAPSEVAFFTTTASALSQAALKIPLNPGDEILTWDQEYPSNFYPWRIAAEKAGAKLIQVSSENYDTPFEKLLEKVTERTKVIAISWVQYQAGAVTELKKISNALRDRDIWLVADVIQGAGVRPLNFKESGFDIICGGSHKFMCSGYGAAYMVMKAERMKMIEPIEVGAMTFGTPDTAKSYTVEAKTDSHRYEPGTKSMVEIIAMGATLDLFEATGIENIFQESSRLAARLSQGLANVGYRIFACEGQIVNFGHSDIALIDQLSAKLAANRISHVKRGPGIRLSTHAFLRDEQIDKVVAVLSKN